MGTTIAVLNKNGRDASRALVQALKQLGQAGSCFILASPFRILEADGSSELVEANLSSSVLIGCVVSRNLDKDELQIAQIDNGASVFEGRLYSDTPGAGAFELLTQSPEPKAANERLMRNLLTEAQGDFSLVAVEPEKILATRDPMGVQPLYYGETDDFVALASNRAALWALGISKSRSFPPGNVAFVTCKGVEFIPVKTLFSPEVQSMTIDDAARKLQKLLEHSVRIRVRDLENVAVAFSGGLDSSLIAFLAKECSGNVRLFHVSLSGQTETEEAKKIADEMKLPLNVYLYEAKDVERTLPEVVTLIEEPDPVKVAIGVPFYWLAKRVAESGYRILLGGQGADEIFGGYQRYVAEYLSDGESKVQETIYRDVARLHESNIERDETICRFHGVKLRLPFASYEIAEFALSLPLELKIEKQAHGIRKLVLRRMALNVGLPDFVANKPKKALQYSTGVSAILRKIADKQDVTSRAYVEHLFREERNNRQRKYGC